MSSRVISLTWAKEISEKDTKRIENRGFRSIELNVKMTSILLKKNQNSAFTKRLILNLTIAFSYNG